MAKKIVDEGLFTPDTTINEVFPVENQTVVAPGELETAPAIGEEDAPVEEVDFNLSQRILEVKKTIDFFRKDTKGYNFTYVSGTQVLSKIKAKMEEMGIMLFPEITFVNPLQIIEVPNRNGELHNEYIVSGTMNYVFEDVASREQKTIMWHFYGQQIDPSQAFGSALTYSERYFLLKFFNIPTDDADPDARKPKEPEDNRPWFNEKQLETALARIANGEEGIYEKIDKAFKISNAHREILKNGHR